MRHFFFAFLLLALTTSESFAQRPWILASNPSVGSAPQLSTAANLLHIFDEQLATSLDQGKTWDSVEIVESHVRAMGDFFGNVTLCVSQKDDTSPAHVYFTTTGTSWTPSDTLNLGKAVVSVGAVGQVFFLSTREGMMYARGVEIDSMPIQTAPNTEIVDVVINEDVMAATTSTGIYLSTDMGMSWQSTNPPGTDNSSLNAFNLVLHRDGVLCPTPNGVYLYSLDDQAWQPVGVWEGFPVPPRVVSVTAKDRWILALTRTSENRHQMYRLESGDSVWIETGYEVPGDEPFVTKNMFVIDAGWAVLRQASPLDADSNGVYIYNLNDFTSVEEDRLNALVSIRNTQNGISITHPWQSASVTLVDLQGRHVMSNQRISAGTETLQLAPYIKGVLGVVVQGPTGITVRRVILR